MIAVYLEIGIVWLEEMEDYQGAGNQANLKGNRVPTLLQCRILAIDCSSVFCRWRGILWSL